MDNSNQTPKILVVEDDLSLSKMYSEKFKLHGYRVFTAKDGENALKLLSSDPNFDLILLDMMLPKLSGIQILQVLSQNPTTANIPVIALTNLAQKNNQEQAVTLGVKEYLIKAMYSPEQIVQKVHKHLSSR